MVEKARLPELTHEQLVQLAKARGLELPSGYVKKDELIRLLHDAPKRKAQ